MIQNDIYRASIDVQSILEKIQKEIETGNPSSGIQGEALKNVRKPKGTIQNKGKSETCKFSFLRLILTIYFF